MTADKRPLLLAADAVQEQFERRAQKISWAIGQVLCQRRYDSMPVAELEEEEWRLRLHVAKYADGAAG